jgi:hypothetical protein
VKKIKRALALLAAIGLTSLLFTPSIAQEGVKYADDARYMRVVFVSYKPGKAAEAYGIINDHFNPAGQSVGLDGPVIVHFQTGPYDAAFHWRLDGGPSDLEWRVSPESAAFRAALAAREGGEEAAQALMDRYNSLIARSTSAIGHRHVPEDE